MDRGTEIYKNIIDELVKMSKSCADEIAIKKGKIPSVDAEELGINELLRKLNEKERDILAKFVLETYHSGIYDTLEQLEWLRCHKRMDIIVDGESLPLSKYEGMPNDYIGRCSDWKWPKE